MADLIMSSARALAPQRDGRDVPSLLEGLGDVVRLDLDEFGACTTGAIGLVRGQHLHAHARLAVVLAVVDNVGDKLSVFFTHLQTHAWPAFCLIDRPAALWPEAVAPLGEHDRLPAVVVIAQQGLGVEVSARAATRRYGREAVARGIPIFRLIVGVGPHQMPKVVCAL